MAGLGRHWAGRVFGTNTGNVYVELESSATGVNGVLRFNDIEQGVVVYDVEGTFADGELRLTGKPQPSEEQQLGDLTVSAKLNAQGSFDGQWTTTLGTGGVFVLHPQNQQATAPAPGTAAPEQLHTVVRRVGAVRLYARDVRQLIDAVRQDFSHTRAIVTYRGGGAQGTEIVRHADEFLQDSDKIQRLNYLKIGIAEPEAYGLNRNVTVELDGVGTNEIRVQAVQGSWALGKAEGLAAHVKQYEKRLVTSFRQFGLNVNSFILIGSLVALPELPLRERVVFVAFVFALVLGIARIHSRHIPNATIFLTAKTPGWIERSSPQILSWLVAATSAVAASVMYGLLKGELAWPDFLVRLLT